MIDIATMQYKRLYQFPKWLISLQEQTMVKNIRVNIWNNSGQELDIPQGFSFPIRVFGLAGYENFGSQARFHLAMHLESENIIYLDDDNYAAPTFVEEAMAAAEKYPGEVLGRYAKRIPADVNYYDASWTSGNSPRLVDWIGTTGMIVPLRLCQLPELRAIPDPHGLVEDVYFAYLMAKMGVTMRYMPFPCTLRHDKYASFVTYRARGMEAAYEELRKDWILLCERT